jgi:hypothetical protein
MSQQPLDLLRRSDKWYVGCGDGLVWAPPFPAWHDTPGFWDEAHLVQYPVAPLFSLSFLRDGIPFDTPRARSIEWSPADFTLRYELGGQLRAIEVRSAPGDRLLASQWEVRNGNKISVTLDVVLWSAVDGESVADDGVVEQQDALRLTRTVHDRKEQSIELQLDYRFPGGQHSWSALRSESTCPIPHFRLTPFYDRWPANGRLTNRATLGGISRHGLVYLAIARRLRIAAGGSAQFTASVQVTPSRLPVPAPARRTRGGPGDTARRHWNTFASSVPSFTSSDPWLNRYWWYRWYGLRLNAVPGGLGQYRDPTVCEGIAYFHQPISYSAMCHAREVRWSNDAAWSWGVLQTFLDRVSAEGAIPGRVYLDHLIEPDFYHADWAGALDDVSAVHPDSRKHRELVGSLSRYAEWLSATRDREGSGMIDVVDQYETGQEYMSRYQAVDPSADRYGWENRLRLKGIDVSVYAYRLFQMLARHSPDEQSRSMWSERAARTSRAIRERMWDPSSGMFSDVHPVTGERTGVKAAVCFYPYLTDLVNASHLEGLERHLFNRAEFWTPFPAPSSSADDPLFDPNAEWKGKRHVCPWNGRVWPMTNSHLIDALARVVRTYRPDWARHLVIFLRQFIRMMSFDGDVNRPNCFEHYHPMSGKGSLYRGIDDYQHSWVNDLLVRHVGGILPRGEQGVVIDPLPFGVNASFTGVPVAGQAVEVSVTASNYVVRIHGKRAGRGKIGVPLELSW